MFTKLLFVATILPLAFGFPIGAPNFNDGNAAIGQGSYHGAPGGVLSNLGIAVCMDGTNVNTNLTIHVEPNSHLYIDVAAINEWWYRRDFCPIGSNGYLRDLGRDRFRCGVNHYESVVASFDVLFRIAHGDYPYQQGEKTGD